MILKLVEDANNNFSTPYVDLDGIALYVLLMIEIEASLNSGDWKHMKIYML